MKKIIAALLSAALAVSVFGTVFGLADEKLFGDVNGSGTVTVEDALLVLQYSVGKIPFTDEQKDLARVSDEKGEGEVAVADALMIWQYSVGKITEFPRKADETVHLEIPETKVENGAYTLDESADNSFVIDETGLEPLTFYTIAFKGDVHEMRLIASLQGLINRAYGMDDEHTVLINYSIDGNDSFWLKQMTSKGMFTQMKSKKIVVRDMDTFYYTFANQLKYCGMVTWDGGVPATSNVAATVCGAEGYLPVLKGSAVETKLAELGAEEKLSLFEKFTGTLGTKIPDTDLDSSGSAKNDAYRWALEKYMDRCSAYYVGYILDGGVTIPDNYWSKRIYAEYNCIENFDYLIARHAFCFDLNPNPDDTVCDDVTQPKGTDHDTFIMILQKRYERANGKMGQMMGFPPWWIKYTVDTPGDTGHNGTLGGPQLEWLFCEYITSYNMAMEADAAHPCSMSNGSLMYKYRATATEYKNTDTKEEDMLTFDSSKRYFTIYVGDYDSSAWMKKYVYDFWKDSARGTLPLMWAFNPNLSNRIPVVWDYIYENKTDNDYIVAGEGAGYTMPGYFIENKETGDLRDTKEGWDVWIDYSKKYYQLFDIDITGFIINSTSGSVEVKGINPEIMEQFNKLSPVGSFTNSGSNRKQALALQDGVPYVYLFNEVPFNVDPKTGYASMYSYDRGVMSSFNFSAYRTVVQSPSTIKEVVDGYIDYAENQGANKEYVYVDPYNFFNLIRQSGQGTEGAGK